MNTLTTKTTTSTSGRQTHQSTPLIKAAAALLFGATVSTAAFGQKAKAGYEEINGVKYYYEISGKGEPLLVLHGGLGSSSMFAPITPELKKNHLVVAVDLHGHGRTGLGSREFNLIDQGADMAVLVKKFGFEHVDVMGYSMGGGVAFQFAAQHPAMVRHLVLVSTPYAQSGFYPEMLPMQAQVGAAQMPMMKETPMYKSYVAVAPHPEDFPKLLDQMGAWMRKAYDWSPDIAKLTMPVMLVYGDSDMITLDHAVKFYHALGGGLKDAGWMREHMSKNRLAILPDVTHYEMAIAKQLIPTVLPFLEGKGS